MTMNEPHQKQNMPCCAGMISVDSGGLLSNEKQNKEIFDV